MGYGVQSYLTDAEKIKKVYASKEITLFESLEKDLKANFERLGNDFKDFLDEKVFPSSILLDIVNGEIRFPKFAFLYGYVYELLCQHYGELVYPPDEYSINYFWEIPREPKAFIPIPFTKDFPDIYSIKIDELQNEKDRFLQIKEIKGMSAEQIDLEKKDFEFIFDKAIKEKKDLAFFSY